LVSETQKLKLGSPDKYDNFIGPVIHERSFSKLSATIDSAKKDPSVQLLTGGQTDSSVGWFIEPTIFQVEDPNHWLMKTEFFGPIATVYVYRDSEWEQTLQQVDQGSKFALTGAVFADDREALVQAEKALRQSAGNFYINTKSSGALVGHQPFGGARASGTNDKATSTNLLSRFTSLRSIKEDLVGTEEIQYPSNEV